MKFPRSTQPYINICGTFYYLCSILDGYSRYLVHWDIGETMKEEDIELIVQEALEKYENISPRIISDNGPQFISREFKKFVRLAGMDHVRTSPYYPQSNGKIERWHRELKSNCIRAERLESLADAKAKTKSFIEEYNDKRLHASIGYVNPKDKLLGKEKEIFADRDRKLEEARKARSEERKKLKNQSKMTKNNKSTGGYGNAAEQPERLVERGDQKAKLINQTL